MRLNLLVPTLRFQPSRADASTMRTRFLPQGGVVASMREHWKKYTVHKASWDVRTPVHSLTWTSHILRHGLGHGCSRCRGRRRISPPLLRLQLPPRLPQLPSQGASGCVEPGSLWTLRCCEAKNGSSAKGSSRTTLPHTRLLSLPRHHCPFSSPTSQNLIPTLSVFRPDPKTFHASLPQSSFPTTSTHTLPRPPSRLLLSTIPY